MTRVLTLVANSKMSQRILSTLVSEGQRNRVDSCAEILASVDESRLERIRHQCQCWFWANLRPLEPDLPHEADQTWRRHGAGTSPSLHPGFIPRAYMRRTLLRCVQAGGDASARGSPCLGVWVASPLLHSTSCTSPDYTHTTEEAT